MLSLSSAPTPHRTPDCLYSDTQLGGNARSIYNRTMLSSQEPRHKRGAASPPPRKQPKAASSGSVLDRIMETRTPQDHDSLASAPSSAVDVLFQLAGVAGPSSSLATPAPTPLDPPSRRQDANARASPVLRKSPPGPLPAHRPQTPERSPRSEQLQADATFQQSSINRSVLETPRRGRRVGDVKMGWGTPVVDSAEQTGMFPSAAQTPKKTASNTRPRRAARSGSDDVTLRSSPAKRKAVASTPSKCRIKSEHPASLMDSQGWASVGLSSLAGKQRALSGHEQDRVHEASNAPAPFTWSGSAEPTTLRREERLSLFTNAGTRPDAPSRLIAIEVEGMGRVAVHRELAGDIVKLASTAGFRPSDYSTWSLLHNSSDSESSTAHSSTSASTNPTSVGTDISPSISLSSHFPPSEPSSPCTGRTDKAHEALAAILAVSQGQHSAPAESEQVQSSSATKSHTPRLGGLHAPFNPKLPTLDWPDAPDGPWAAAGKQLRVEQSRRIDGIRSWLDQDSDSEALPTQSSRPSGFGVAMWDQEGCVADAQHHHPMVAKVLRDRSRKKAITAAALAQSHANAAALVTPSRKRSRKEPRSGTEDQSRRKRSRRHESGTQRSSVSRRSVHTAKSLARKVLSPLIGCQCGTEDETAPMVNCDACHRWLHMHCVGIADPEELGSQWFCDQCCQQAAQRLSPLSSVAPTSVLSTSDVASQEYMREPVFVQSSESPSLHRGAGLSAALALAPSPASFSNADSNSARRHGGRARAERIGWQMSDPGSPLDRKSTIGSKRYAPPSTPSRHDGGAYDMGDSMTTPSFFAGFPRAEWDSHSRHVRNTTPSPRFGVGLSTPSRHAHSGRGGFSDDEDARNPDDVFSTPSRHVSGSFLGHRAPPSAQTPSRSTQRHHRRESSQNWGLPGAFSTPSRDFLGGAFSTEHSTACSGGLPSLVFSSGGLEAGDSHDHHSSRLWQLQSPTSSTRAARARQVSGQSIGGLPSSALLRTPELQPRTTATTSSIRATRRTSDGYDDQDPPTSSSPFPRTPTFSETAVIRRSPRIASSDRSSLGMGMGMNMGLGMGVPSSSRRLAKLSSSNDHDSTTMGESSDFEGGAGGRAHGNGSGRLSSGALIDLMRSSERPGTGNAVSATKHRQVSSDMPLGLGIGLDIDDVLNWH